MTQSSQASHAHIDYELLSHITHEARGPFNGLIGFSDLLDTGFDSLPVEKQKEYIHLIKLLASKSFFQLQTVISWLKLVSANFNLNSSSFYLSEVVKYALQYNANDFRSKEITTSSDPKDAGKMQGDLNYLSVALANVVSYVLHHIQKQSRLELLIEESATAPASLQIIFTADPKDTELRDMLALLAHKPAEIPEAKTSIWVAGQILTLHRAIIRHDIVTNRNTTISITFP